MRRGRWWVYKGEGAGAGVGSCSRQGGVRVGDGTGTLVGQPGRRGSAASKGRAVWVRALPALPPVVVVSGANEEDATGLAWLGGKRVRCRVVGSCGRGGATPNCLPNDAQLHARAWLVYRSVSVRWNLGYARKFDAPATGSGPGSGALTSWPAVVRFSLVW